MINLIYGSTAVKPMSAEDLMAILEKSHINNRRRNITGMLLYKGGNFLQVLEGEEKVVNEAYTIISRDPRHQSIELIATRQIQARNFDKWEMGFVNLDSPDIQKVAGYTDYLQQSFTSPQFRNGDFAYTFLQVFKEGMR